MKKAILAVLVLTGVASIGQSKELICASAFDESVQVAYGQEGSLRDQNNYSVRHQVTIYTGLNKSVLSMNLDTNAKNIFTGENGYEFNAGAEAADYARLFVSKKKVNDRIKAELIIPGKGNVIERVMELSCSEE